MTGWYLEAVRSGGGWGLRGQDQLDLLASSHTKDRICRGERTNDSPLMVSVLHRAEGEGGCGADLGHCSR